MYDIETLSIDGVSNKEHFYRKMMQKMCSKASPRPLYNFGKKRKSHCMQEILLKVIYFERGLSESLKKGNFVFSFDPSPFL